MRILGLINKDNGSGFHRVMMPLLLMPVVDSYITNSITEADFEKGADIVYYSKVIGDGVLELAHKYKSKIIIDIDDYWHLDPHHISYNQYIETGFAKMQTTQINQAHLITTTHERLAELIYPYNKNVVILPNAIPNHEYFTVSKSESKLPRLFWQGSITHEKDLMLLKNPFKRLTGCATVIAGYTQHDVWGKMVNAFTNGLSLPGMVLPGLPPYQYYSNYSHADICIAPLIKSKFNSLKSNLKVLEAAHAGLPIICSKVDPYLSLPVLYAENQKDWFRHINGLIHDEAMRIELGEVLKGFCEVNYNYETINKKRYGCFNAA
jgi:glycosyltransferase involved in cell wall biosynthesis